MNIKDQIRSEIERLYYNEAEKDESILAADAYKNALDAVEKLLDSLPEQQEVDLEKEIEDYWIATGWSKVITLGKFKVIARYFYVLGQLNSK